MSYGAAFIFRGVPVAPVATELLPGAYALVFGDVDASIEARLAGLHLRDTFLILSSGPRSDLVSVFRKPPEKPTIAEQVLATGTGGLHIDACRVAYASEGDKTPAVGKGAPGEKNPGCGPTLPHHKQNWGVWEVNHRGRWPANLVLVHDRGCALTGYARVEGHKGYPNGPGGSSTQFSQKGTATNRAAAWAGHADADGKESVPTWDCAPGCASAALDAQSGFQKSGVAVRHRGVEEGTMGRLGRLAEGTPDMGYGDSGGASRFYPQFANDDAMFAWLERLILPPETVLFR